MTPTSPLSGYDDIAANAAFTLLELLVVLTLFVLIAGLALPGLTTIHSRFQSAADRDEIRMQIAELGYRVMLRGYGGRLVASPADTGDTTPTTQTTLSGKTAFQRSELPLTLPAGWTLRVKQDLIYLDNGICLGGEIEAVSENDTFTLTLSAPYCRPELAL